MTRPPGSASAALHAFVLVVEDDPDIRSALADVLDAEGYRTRTAVHGRDALDVVAAHGAPCAIVLDLMMPVMNGWQFLAERAVHPRLAEVPVIVVTASPAADCPVGVTCLRKPFSMDELVLLLGRMAGTVCLGAAPGEARPG